MRVYFHSFHLSGLWLFLTFILYDAGIAAQCDSEAVKMDCILDLPENYTIVKSRPVSIQSKKDQQLANFSVKLKKGFRYLVSTCNSKYNGQHMVAELYDKTDELIMSTGDKKNDTVTDIIHYECPSTGNYTLNIFFEEKKGCGYVILAEQGAEKN